MYSENLHQNALGGGKSATQFPEEEMAGFLAVIRNCYPLAGTEALQLRREKYWGGEDRLHGRHARRYE
jgi:hypothetical protein